MRAALLHSITLIRGTLRRHDPSRYCVCESGSFSSDLLWRDMICPRRACGCHLFHRFSLASPQPSGSFSRIGWVPSQYVSQVHAYPPGAIYHGRRGCHSRAPLFIFLRPHSHRSPATGRWLDGWVSSQCHGHRPAVLANLSLVLAAKNCMHTTPDPDAWAENGMRIKKKTFFASKKLF